MWFSKRRLGAAEVARDLREQAFALVLPLSARDPQHGDDTIDVLLLETGSPAGVVSLVCIADGTTSLSFGNGGGVIGAGEHAAVRATARTFFSIAASSLRSLALATEHPVPRSGQVRFYARTANALWAAEAPEDVLAGGTHQLSPLFLAGHGVIAAIRETGAGQ